MAPPELVSAVPIGQITQSRAQSLRRPRPPPSPFQPSIRGAATRRQLFFFRRADSSFFFRCAGVAQGAVARHEGGLQPVGDDGRRRDVARRPALVCKCRRLKAPFFFRYLWLSGLDVYGSVGLLLEKMHFLGSRSNTEHSARPKLEQTRKSPTSKFFLI